MSIEIVTEVIECVPFSVVFGNPRCVILGRSVGFMMCYVQFSISFGHFSVSKRVGFATPLRTPISGSKPKAVVHHSSSAEPKSTLNPKPPQTAGLGGNGDPTSCFWDLLLGHGVMKSRPGKAR